MKLFEIQNNPFISIAYHGSNQDINKFSGISYFTNDIDAAKGYARGKVNINKNGTAKVYVVNLNFKTPLFMDTLQQIGTLTLKDIQDLKNDGYDGAVYLGSKKEPIPEFVPFYPERIMIKDVIEV